LYLVAVRDHRGIKFLVLIAELLDIDTINESEEGAESLIQVLLFVDHFKNFKKRRRFVVIKHFRLCDTSDAHITSGSDFDFIGYVDPVSQI
jgi:hypothetical protein